jgi:hypothetical protein
MDEIILFELRQKKMDNINLLQRWNDKQKHIQIMHLLKELIKKEKKLI